MRPYLKNNRAKRAGAVAQMVQLKWYSSNGTCLKSAKLRVQTPVPPERDGSAVGSSFRNENVDLKDN
jgi:hypothetical protein